MYSVWRIHIYDITSCLYVCVNVLIFTTPLHLVSVTQQITTNHFMSQRLSFKKTKQLFCVIPTVNNAFQFASIIHWISLAILSVFFTEVSLYLPLA